MKRLLSLLFITILFASSASAQSGDLSGLRLKLDDGDATPASNNFITLITPATGSLTANYSLTLPVNDGDANQVLTTDGAGVLTWTTPGSSANWLLAGNSLASASWNGTTGNRLGTNSAHPLVLATTNATAQNILFYTGVSGANERMRINGTDGRIGINETAPESQLHVVSNSIDAGNDLIIEGFNDGDATDGAEVRTRRGRGTFDAPANVQNGDDLGGFKFEGYFQGAFREAAQIDINLVDAPVNDADDNLRVEMGFNLDDGAGNKNRIVTYLPDGEVGIGENNPSERLQVHDGNIYISNSGTAGQLRFQEPNGGGTSYSAFQAGSQSANFVYTLPTTIPTANQVLTASSVSAPNVTLSWTTASSSGTLGVVKTADQQVQEDASLQNDDDLVLSSISTGTYKFEMMLYVTENSSADLTYDFSTTGTLSLVYNRSVDNDVPAVVNTVATDQNIPIDAGETDIIRIFGICTVTSSGNLQFRFANDTATGGGTQQTNVLAGSYMMLIPF